MQQICVNPNGTLPQLPLQQFPKVKPGVCPAQKERQCASTFKNGECTDDSDCSGDLKCCNDGCFRSCTVVAERKYRPNPRVKKAGVCPPSQLPGDGKTNTSLNCGRIYGWHMRTPRGNLMASCSDDENCNGDLKCCGRVIGCRVRSCTVPQQSKDGSCPTVPLSSQCQDVQSECSDDSQCNGKRKCCHNGCFRTCIAVPDTQARAEMDNEFIGNFAVLESSTIPTNSATTPNSVVPAWAIALIVTLSVMFISLIVIAVLLTKKLGVTEKP